MLSFESSTALGEDNVTSAVATVAAAVAAVNVAAASPTAVALAPMTPPFGNLDMDAAVSDAAAT